MPQNSVHVRLQTEEASHSTNIVAASLTCRPSQRRCGARCSKP
jgi:hypothetical protein